MEYYCSAGITPPTVFTKIKIKEITLLSIEEYKAAREYIPISSQSWWLRSPSLHAYRAAFVHGGDGYVTDFGCDVRYPLGVRPALIYDFSSDIQVKSKFTLNGYYWTVINKNMVLCDTLIKFIAFNKNLNNYETSNIKRWLDEWARLMF